MISQKCIYRIQIIKVGKTKISLIIIKYRINRRKLINKIILTNNINITGCHLSRGVTW